MNWSLINVLIWSAVLVTWCLIALVKLTSPRRRQRREDAERKRFDRMWDVGQSARRDFKAKHGYYPGPYPHWPDNGHTSA